MPDNTTAAELADWHAQQAEQRRQALGWQGEDKVTGPALRKLHADIEFHAQACDSIRALIAPNGVIAWAHPYGRVVPASTMESAKRDGGAMESSLAGYTIPCVAALLRASEGRAPDGAAGVVEKALRRSFSLGQTYWQQADSDFVSQHKKSDYTQQRFEALCAETVAMLTAAPHPPAQQADPAWFVSEMHRILLEGAAEMIKLLANAKAIDWSGTDVGDMVDRLTAAAKGESFTFGKPSAAFLEAAAIIDAAPPAAGDESKPSEKWCYSFCGERYSGPFDSREEAIAEARSPDRNEGECFIAKRLDPVEFIRPASIGRFLEEHITEMLADEVGEVCDRFEVGHDAIGQVVIDWIMAHGGFGCWGVKDIERVDLTTQEPSA